MANVRSNMAVTKSIPVEAVKLWVKQVDQARINRVSMEALHEACAQFMSPSEFARLIPNQAYAPVAKSEGRERRFAGDPTLPRGRYYTLCFDQSGDDGGTLLSELIAYFDETRTGSVGFEEVDLSPPDIAAAYASFGYRVPSHRRALVLWFLTVNGRLPPFLEYHGFRSSQPVGVWVPLVIREGTWRRALDLRKPAVGDWFAQAVSKMRMPLFKGVTYPVFPNRPRLKNFWGILPSLLHQDLGGDYTCRAIGAFMRTFGVEALIYPSARTDCGVLVERGIVTRWHGWNLVDYRNADRIGGVTILQEGHEWPRFVWEGRGFGSVGDELHRVVATVGIERKSRGPRKGSWQAFGIAARLRDRVAPKLPRSF